MSTEEILNIMFGTALDMIRDFIATDLFLVFTSLIILLVIMFCIQTLINLLNVSPAERSARQNAINAFELYKRKRNSFDAPLYRRDYYNALSAYDSIRFASDEEEEEKIYINN
jgi:hypothetical protein